MTITSKLITWYDRHKRDLPWRNTHDPYHIWLSEIILQQTRVEQGLPYYNAFISKYPDVCKLAGASEDEVLRTWQGLGYYSRARNLHATAKWICINNSGNFPNTFDEIIKLKGIGPYTAAAIASFAFEEAKPVVDGNVFRFLSRLYAIDIPINRANARGIFETYAAALMEGVSPGTFNQALMEFGALQCTPGKPDCSICVLKDDCRAYELGLTAVLPVKEKTQKVKTIYFNFLHFNSGEKIFIEKRTDDGIWKNMYQFPLVESEGNWAEEDLTEYISTEARLGKEMWRLENIYRTRHILSHRKIEASIWKIRLPDGISLNKNNIFEIPAKDLDNYAIPRLLEKYIEENQL